MANQACALFFFPPTCSPLKTFETWGAAPDPAPAGGLIFCPPSPPRTRGKKAGQKGGKEEKKERWTKGGKEG